MCKFCLSWPLSTSAPSLLLYYSPARIYGCPCGCSCVGKRSMHYLCSDRTGNCLLVYSMRPRDLCDKGPQRSQSWDTAHGSYRFYSLWRS